MQSSRGNQIFNYLASNAATIYNTLDFSFSCLDLSNLNLDGALMQQSFLCGANLKGTSLENVNITESILIETDLSNSNMKDVEFGKFPDFQDQQEDQGQVTSISFSAKGDKLVSCGTDLNIRIWSYPQGEIIQKFTKCHDNSYILCVNFDIQGKFIASSADDGTIKIWDIEKGFVRTLIGHFNSVLSVYFSPDGKYLISASTDSSIRIWDWQSSSNYKTNFGHTDAVCFAMFSPSGKQFVTASNDKSLKVWNFNSLFDIQIDKLYEGHTGCVQFAKFSVDEQYLVSGGMDYQVKIWNKETKECKTLLGHNGQVTSGLFSQCGKKVVSGSQDKTIKVWNTITGECIKTLEGHTGYIYCVKFSSCQKQIVSSGQDGTIKIWDFESDQYKQVYGHSEFISSIAYSPCEKYIATASFDRKIIIWDTLIGQSKQLLGHERGIYQILFSYCGNYIISCGCDNLVIIWNIIKNKHFKLASHDEKVITCHLSYDQNLIASAGQDKKLIIWGFQQQKELLTIKAAHLQNITCVKFFKNKLQSKYQYENDYLVISGSNDQTAKIWKINYNLNNQNTQLQQIISIEGFQGNILSLDISYDDKYLILAGYSSYIQIIDVQKYISQFSQNNKKLIINANNINNNKVNKNDQQLTINDKQTIEGKYKLSQNDYDILTIKFSSSSYNIIYGSKKNTITILKFDHNNNLQSTQKLLGHTKPITCAVFSKDESFVASCGVDFSLKLWKKNQQKNYKFSYQLYKNISQFKFPFQCYGVNIQGIKNLEKQQEKLLLQYQKYI